MRWLTLYLRSRRAPLALLAAGGWAAAMWTLWSVFSDDRRVGVQMVVLTVLLLVAALTATLGGPDDELEGTAGFRWPPRRAAHLLAAFLIVVVLLLATLATGAHFAPAGLVVRDAGGLLGLTALGAATLGTARAWFLPLGWTVAAVLFPQSAEPLIGRILTWQAQPPVSPAATVTAGLLALGGLIAYAAAGPTRRAPAEATQQ
jgi:hypothetical protein